MRRLRRGGQVCTTTERTVVVQGRRVEREGLTFTGADTDRRSSSRRPHTTTDRKSPRARRAHAPAARRRRYVTTSKANYAHRPGSRDPPRSPFHRRGRSLLLSEINWKMRSAAAAVHLPASPGRRVRVARGLLLLIDTRRRTLS